MNPEERARQQIDLLLLQDRSQTNLAAGSGVVIREALLKAGEADYLLFAGGKAIATVEAKPEGYTLTGVEGQSCEYATGLLDIYPRWSDPLPFAYESTGSETRFSNRLDPNHSNRDALAFHRPDTPIEWAAQTAELNQRLRVLPLLSYPKAVAIASILIGKFQVQTMPN